MFIQMVFIRPSSDGKYNGMVMSARPSVNNSCYHISSEATYHKDFFVFPVCLPYGVVVHLRL